MRALIAGSGSIARRHLKNLRHLVPAAHITVLRRSPSSSATPSEWPDADQLVSTLDEACAGRPELAIVASPAPFHVETALALARQNCHLLIEKPLSHSLAGIDPLLAECDARRLVLLIGYTLRFLPALNILRQALTAGRIGRVLSFRAEVGQYLPDWRPGTDYRASVSAKAELGGGAILELSHEIDYIRWLLGDAANVFALSAKTGDLEIDVEDVAEITLRLSSGAVGSIHVDMLQRTPCRQCKIIGTTGTLIWDNNDNSVRLFSADKSAWEHLAVPPLSDRNAMYCTELAHFLACIEGTETPAVSGRDALQVLRIALAAKESARTGSMVQL